MENNNLPQLILLHGALGTLDQFDYIWPQLKEYFQVNRLNFEGHGQAGPTESDFRIEYFAENVLGFMDEHDIEKANIFGYSMGGYVALVLAKEYPHRINKIATLGTILQWNKDVAWQECRYLYPDKIKKKVPHFAEQLKERHLSGWERVVRKTREMLRQLGEHPNIKAEDWKNFKHVIRFHIGDRDTTAELDKTVKVYKKVDKAELMVLPHTSHPIAEVNMPTLVASLRDFFKQVQKPEPGGRAQKKNGN